MDAPKQAIDPIDRTFRYLGLLLTVASAALTFAWASTFKIHWLVDIILPIGLVGAAVASAYAWPRVVDRIRDHGWMAAIPVIMFAGLFTATDIVSNFGSIAWQRTVDTDNASMQNAKYEDTRKAVEEDEAKLKLLESNLLSLQTRNAWAASVNAVAMRTKLTELNAAADREAQRGGCGSKCEAIKREIINLTDRISTIEQRDDLTKRIELTRDSIAKRRSTAHMTEKAQSGAALSTVSFASMFTLTRTPNEAAMHWTDKGLSWLVAAFFTFGAMGCNLIGWGNLSGRKDETPAAPTVSRATPPIEHRIAPPPAQRKVVVLDRADPEWMRAIRNGLQSLDGKLERRTA